MQEITKLLHLAGEGDASAKQQLFEIVYGELRTLARQAMRSERRGHTFQPTALVHEVFLRLTNGASVQFTSRVHFFSIAARTMRRVLVDYARQINTQKRSAGDQIELDEGLLISEGKVANILILEQALDRLELTAPRQCRVVELRYYAGLELDEVAAALDISRKTVQRDWVLARAWLHTYLAGAPPSPEN
jgi:RNA polymerase sigma factor (TIGR02999 family)